jgi:hypothetical protein
MASIGSEEASPVVFSCFVHSPRCCAQAANNFNQQQAVLRRVSSTCAGYRTTSAAQTPARWSRLRCCFLMLCPMDFWTWTTNQKTAL